MRMVRMMNRIITAFPHKMTPNKLLPSTARRPLFRAVDRIDSNGSFALKC
jgi:hypothetical protein